MKEDIIKYASDLEDKICNLNGEIANLQQENERLKEWKEDLLNYIDKHPVNACHNLLNMLQNGDDENV